MFPQIFGKYVLERELAAGGMARVYLATLRGAVGFEKRLVVKQIRPELSVDEAFVRRFIEEAKIAVELSHPNIVPVYELGVEQGVYYIAMELCEGLTLTEVLGETGPLDAAEGAYVGIEICRALDYAHRRGGIVHRDVTPRNVLIDEEGAVRVIDFGIAAPVVGARAEERIEVFGSPGHMPPEQIRGERLTPATDVFAIGALLIEAWTGRPPFRRDTFEASAQALSEPLEPLAFRRPELASVAVVIERAVALAAEERPQEPEQLARKLREFFRQFDAGDVAKRIGERVRRARGRERSSVPWSSADSSVPLTPAASPRALFSQRAEAIPADGPRTPATPPWSPPVTSAGTAPITRTFAARDDLAEWTRKIASVPPPDAPRLDDTPPPSVPEPTTSIAGPAPVPPGPVSRQARRVALLIVVMAALLSAVAMTRRNVREAPRSTPAERPRIVAASLALPAGTSSTTSGSSEPPVVRGSPSAAPPARASGPGRGPTASASIRPTSESATLKLTSDPAATVTVTGARLSQTQVTPVRTLKLPPGAYSVTFRSATFGEPVVARVELTPGASRSVHADFRAAMPTVAVR